MMRPFLFFTFVSLLVLFTGCELNGPAETNGVHFDRTFSGLHVWYGVPFVPTPTGSLLIDPGADSSSIFIDTRIEFDHGGAIRSRSTLDHSPYIKSSTMIRCASGDLVFITRNLDSNTSAIQCFGNDSLPKWTTPLQNVGMFGPSWVIDRGNGELWVQAIAQSSGSTSRERLIIALNAATGKELRRESIGSIQLSWPHVMANGNLCGIAVDYDNVAHRGFTSVVMVDPSQRVIHKAVLKDTMDDHWVQAVQYLGDTAIVTGGNFFKGLFGKPYNGYSGMIGVSLFDMNGSMQWSRVTDEYASNMISMNVASMTVNNGTIYFAPTDMSQRGTLYMMGTDGAMISQRSFLDRQIAVLCPRTVGGAVALLRDLSNPPNQRTELLSLP